MKYDKIHWDLFNFHSEDQSEEASEFRRTVIKTTQERLGVTQYGTKIIYLMNGPKAGQRLAIAENTKTIQVMTYTIGCLHFTKPNVRTITYVPYERDQWKTPDDYQEGICPDCIIEAKARYTKQNRWYRKLWTKLT
jgi:hypothetical protein